MKDLNIAVLQIMPESGLEANLQKGIDCCKKAKAMGADIALFPEMFSCGYDIPEDTEMLRLLAVDREGEFVSAFGRLAKELEMAIGITYLEVFEPRPRNTMTLFDRHGARVMDYAKVHTCDFGDEIRLSAGDDFYVCDLDVGEDTVKVGAMICYDREFPESARILMLKGAEIILVPNACPMEINRLSQLRARAFENMVGIVTCNYPEGKPDCNGHSSAFDGVAYREGVEGSCDTCLLETGGEEGIYIVSLPLDDIRDYRSREVHGNAYRKPEKYGLLVNTAKAEPFIR